MEWDDLAVTETDWHVLVDIRAFFHHAILFSRDAVETLISVDSRGRYCSKWRLPEMAHERIYPALLTVLRLVVACATHSLTQNIWGSLKHILSFSNKDNH